MWGERRVLRVDRETDHNVCGRSPDGVFGRASGTVRDCVMWNVYCRDEYNHII